MTMSASPDFPGVCLPRGRDVRMFGSALISMYDAGIDDLSTGVLFSFYRQTDEGIFVPLRDPAATWRNAWLEHILNADAETKRLLLTDMLRDICVDPNFPHPVVETKQAAIPSIGGQSSLARGGTVGDADLAIRPSRVGIERDR